MALDLLIPRIEWNELSIVGDTNTSIVVNDILDTTNIKVGMIVTGSGVAAGTTVASKTVNTMTLSLPTSSTLNNTTLTLFERFDFTYPPSVDSDEKLVSNSVEVRSLSGLSQVQSNYLEYQRNATYDFLTEEQKDILKEDFFRDWSRLGKEFRYFYDKADSGFVTYSLIQRQFDVKRQVKKHPNFLYQLKMSMKRVE